MFVSMSNIDLGLRRKQLEDYYKSINKLRFRNTGISSGISEVSQGDLESVELGEAVASDVITESTPLLSGSTGVTTGISGASTAVGSVLSSIPGTAIGATAGIVGAGIIGGIYNTLTSNKGEAKHKKPFITLPDHNYLGPGNSINTGEKPLDKDDLGALNHDLDYNKAKTSEEVREADREHILNSIDDILTGDIHSVISGAGIAAKYGVESLTGVKYPITG